jgi:hypothetical protein
MVSSGTRSLTIGKAITVAGIVLMCAGLVFGQAQVAPVPQQPFFDNTGAICSGCLLSTFVAGTTTPLATFSDSALSVQNANPLTLNAAGRNPNGGIYVSAATYKWVLQTPTGGPIYTQDNVPSPSLLTTTGALGSGTANNTTFLRGDQTWAKAWTVVTSTSVGTLNDFAPGLVGNTVVRMNNATLATITGFAGGFDGQRVIVQSVGAGQVDEAHQNASSLAQDRFINFATSGNTSEAAGVGVVEYLYDGTATRWRLVAHEQGAWITPTYSGAFYTASSGTWTVDAGDVQTQAYYLKGRSLTVVWFLSTTSTSATPASLFIANGAWGGFTTSKTTLATYVYNDNAGGNTVGFTQVSAAGTTVPMSKLSGSFSVSTNNTNVFGEIVFEVQD